MEPTASQFERDAQRMAATLLRHRYIILAALTALYGLGVVRHAAAKPLWYDELFTVMLASSPDAASTWKAAQEVDASPPLTHLLTHFAMRWFGGGEVATRLPAIAGFWIFCLSLFWFVKRRLGIFYGLAALLMPLATQAYEYAYEARAYGLELGFCGLVLLSWQAATSSEPQEKLRHAAACAALSLSLVCALLCHYYAFLIYIPVAGSEAWRCWQARRVDWGIWIGMAVGAAPLAWHAATIRSVVRGFAGSAWDQPYPFQILEFWEGALRPAISVLVLSLAVVALWAWKRPEPGPPSDAPPRLPPHELLAGILFLTIPVFVVATGILITHVFFPRYALPALAGVVLLAPAVVSRLSAGRQLPAFVMMALCLIPLFVVTATVSQPRNVLAEESVLVSALAEGPVVVTDGQLFVQMWHYTPEPLKHNLIFLVDSQAAATYAAFNTVEIDATLASFRHRYPLRVLDYRSFATPGREFRVLQNLLRPGWLLTKIAADGGSETIDRYTNVRQLYRVRIED